MNAWKGVVLTLVGLMIVVVLFNLFNPVKPQKTADDKMMSDYQSYMDEAKKKSDDYYKRADEAINKANTINDLSLANQKRFEKILERWEKQADKMDKVLVRLEKNM